MGRVLNDLRLARRLLVKSPLFTAVVVVTLALGIGLNTAVFSAVDTMLLRPLPGVRSPSELVQVYRSHRGGDRFRSSSIPHFNDLRERSKDVFSGVAAFSLEYLSVSASERPQRVLGVMASANYFSVLGVGAARGRMFTPDEDVGRGAHQVVVLSDAAWRGLFARDPGIVGRAVVVNGRSYTVVGVTPPAFKGTLPIVTPALWIPLMQLGQVRPGYDGAFDQRDRTFMSVIARLKPGVSVARANDRMSALLSQLRAEYPVYYEDMGINLVPQSEAGNIHPGFKDTQVGLSAVVMAVVGILLLIACANVANLFLARARSRDREMAIRLSLGAGRAAVARQLLTESLVFAGAAGLAGLAVARWAIGLANRIPLPVEVDFRPDLRLSPAVLVFALGVTVVTGLIFGLVPALQATRPALVPALKGEAQGGSRSRMSRGLVVAQTALSIVLLVCAGLFLRNLKAATTIDTGFVSDNLFIAELDPGMQGYSRARSDAFYRALMERMSAMPAVRAIGLGRHVPMGFSGSDDDVSIPGYTPAPHEDMSVSNSAVSPGYFEALGMPVVEGRGFTAQDDSAAPPVLVVNRRFAERFWPGQDAVGRPVRTAGRDHTVIGVVPTGKYQSLGEEPTPFMYLAQAQHWRAGVAVFVRTAGDPSAVAATLRTEVAALDPNLPLANARTMNSHLGIALLPARLVGGVLGVFGFLALGLASVGIYGVVAYSVAQRTREIGIRMALGAAASDAVLLVMRQGLAPVLLGTALGMAGALAASRLIRGVLYGGSGLDPVTFAAVPLALIGVAMLATWIPARRAASVDPTLALRQE